MSGKVTIIIPYYNSEEFIAETLRSIASQTYPNWECICVDDGSADASSAIVHQWELKDSRFKSVNRPSGHPKGGNSCRNYGFDLSTGEFIQWFDSDDIMCPTMLERKIEAFRSDSKLNYVICETGCFSKDIEDATKYDQHLDSARLYYDYLSFRTKFFTPGPMFRKEFLNGMKLFDTALKRHQEKEFFFRVILKDQQYGIIPEMLILRRLHENSLSVVSDRSKQKIMASFLADKLMFQHYRNSGIVDTDMAFFFKQKFWRYIIAFAKQLMPLASLKSAYYYGVAVRL